MKKGAPPLFWSESEDDDADPNTYSSRGSSSGGPWAPTAPSPAAYPTGPADGIRRDKELEELYVQLHYSRQTVFDITPLDFKEVIVNYMKRAKDFDANDSFWTNTGNPIR